MRIGIDARELCGRATGVGRYLSGLLAAWSQSARARAHEFILYAPTAPPLRLDARQFTLRTVEGAGNWWWEQVRAPRAAGADHLDAWFAPAYTAPLDIETPIALAVHDLSFFARPEWFSVREGIRRRWLTRRSVARAAAVITISEFSKRELMERLDVPATKISVIPPGIGAGGWGIGAGGSEIGTGSQDLRQAGSASPKPRAASPRLLFVGSLFTRRHVPDLIRAFGAIARTHADAALDIVGDNRTYPREDIRRIIDNEGLARQASWHEYVSDAQLASLYAGARAFAFLSEYEGLGLPPLEALAAGVPPVLLDTPVARESCGDAALFVPFGDRSALTHALEAALFDDDVRGAVMMAAPAALSRYRWPRAADDTLQAIERCCR